MAVGLSDISGNDWCGPVNSSPSADRMSNKIFGANPVFWPKFEVGTRKNDHVHPLGLAIICEEVKKEKNKIRFKSNSCIKFADFYFRFRNLFTMNLFLTVLMQATSHKSV